MMELNKNEIWKDIEGYEGLYQISNLGRVKSLQGWNVNKDYQRHKRTHIMTPQNSGAGYFQVHLRKDGVRKPYFIHRLVATAFLPNPNGYSTVNHIDYNRANNKVQNLEWCTQKMNTHHSAERMKHPKNVTHSNTGEKYIYLDKRRNMIRYRVAVDGKERKTKTLEEAIAVRDQMVKEREWQSL